MEIFEALNVVTGAGAGDLVHGALQRGGAGQHDQVSPGQRRPELLLDWLQQGEGGVQASVHRPVPPRRVSAESRGEAIEIEVVEFDDYNASPPDPGAVAAAQVVRHPEGGGALDQSEVSIWSRDHGQPITAHLPRQPHHLAPGRGVRRQHGRQPRPHLAVVRGGLGPEQVGVTQQSRDSVLLISYHLLGSGCCHGCSGGASLFAHLARGPMSLDRCVTYRGDCAVRTE